MNPRSTELAHDAPPGAVLLAASAMGTRFELVLPDDGTPPAHRRAAGEAALAEIIELDQRLSLFRKDSLLAHINREAQHAPVRLDDDTFALLSICVDVWRESDGAFDITVAPLMRQWGLHSDSVLPSSDARASTTTAAPVPICGPDGCTVPGMTPPGPDDSRPNSAIIELDEGTKSIRFGAPITLDLGGVAKGFALDIAVRALRDATIEHAFLQGGTSAIAALGSSQPGNAMKSPWRVGITVPEGAAPNGTVVIELANMTMCVSAHHGRVADGYGHIIDPRRGEPARSPTQPHASEVAAVIVDLSNEALTWTCSKADAWTKPVLLQGARHERIPPSMTTLVATQSMVTIDGRHRESASSVGSCTR